MAGILDFLFGASQEDPNDPKKAQGILATNPDPTMPTEYTGVLNTAQAPAQVPQAQPQVAPQAAPQQQAPVDPDSLASRFKNASWDTHLMAVLRGLGAAGSRDPMKAAAEFAQQDMETAKTKADLARAKVQPIAGGAAYMITEPGKEPRVVSLPEMQQYLLNVKKIENDNSLAKILLTKQLEAQVAGAKDDIKRGGEAREQLASTDNLISGWTQAKQIVDSQAKDAPTASKVQGVVPGIAGFFGGDQVASNKFLQGLTVDETLLNTARTKGAISDKEMALFKSPLPSLSDDRETVWKPFIEKRLEVLNKIRQYQADEAARGENPSARIGNGGGASTGGSSGGSNYQGLSEAEVKKFNPNAVYEPGYQYSIVDGKLKRKKL